MVRGLLIFDSRRRTDRIIVADGEKLLNAGKSPDAFLLPESSWVYHAQHPPSQKANSRKETP